MYCTVPCCSCRMVHNGAIQEDHRGLFCNSNYQSAYCTTCDRNRHFKVYTTWSGLLSQSFIIMYFNVLCCYYTLTVQKCIKMNRNVPSRSYNIVQYSTSESSAWSLLIHSCVIHTVYFEFILAKTDHSRGAITYWDIIIFFSEKNCVYLCVHGRI